MRPRLPRTVRARRWTLVAAAALAGLLALAVAAQLVLPSIVAQRLREHLGADGKVESVSVSAFPAVELLWGDADHVSVDFASLDSTTQGTADLIEESAAATDVHVSIGTFQDGPLTLRDVSFRKRGSELNGTAILGERALTRVLPPGLEVRPVASGSGRLLLRAQAGLFGFGLGVDMLLSAQSGALTLSPVGIPFGGLAALTVFSDPRVQVDRVGASSHGNGYLLRVSGHLSG